MSEQKIKYIDINKIVPHPKNPRKKLTDLEELADSIKENGIMQNLTVVPWYSQFTGKPGDNGSTDGEYYAVIGHRRLAAAKLAGLKEAPCVISDMDEKQQVAIMLMENMQRSDLTIIEEAEGMQMMFDLGSTADEIAEKTGLSKTTINRRVQLLDLDREKLSESFERGGKLQDYLELHKIKDQETRNLVMAEIGTNNFEWSLKKAIRAELGRENKAAIIEMVSEFAKEVQEADWSIMTYVTAYGYYTDEERAKPKDWQTEEYFFRVASNDVFLYKRRPDNDETEEDLQSEKRRIDKNELDEIKKRMYEMRFDFVKKLPQNKVKKNSSDITAFAVMVILNNFSNWFNRERLASLLGIENHDGDELEKKIIEVPEKALLSMQYLRADDDHRSYADYDNRYKGNKELDSIYNLLEILGYKMSDEEIAIRNGTHELYAREEEE
ncbi:ParB/RepB/Spo0J family partition protein [Acetobacterium wieringae]|uniref:Chromosome-partitioning protein Spo0J n=1 Tax=Acetobacterium wieringae TaxID=52694 RepID=A0A1F2PE22_9FIRM|nr:ParB/RepB/Spo0J family partition protein [Acetobacterium wieringae]OFV69275.1 chromosome-partitioning protein Spo0J [Acetobacterium wieringae]